MIPIIGYFLIFNENVVGYLRLADEVLRGEGGGSVRPDVGFFRLQLVYFGLCFYAIASALYQLFCPPEVKGFPTDVDYVDRYRTNISPALVERLWRDMQSRERYRDKLKELQIWYDEKKVSDTTHAREMFDRSILTLNYESHTRRHKPVRVLAGALYAVSLILLAIPSVDIFTSVAGNLQSHLPF